MDVANRRRNKEALRSFKPFSRHSKAIHLRRKARFGYATFWAVVVPPVHRALVGMCETLYRGLGRISKRFSTVWIEISICVSD